MTLNRIATMDVCRMVVQSQPLPFLRAAALNCSVVIAVAGLPSNVLFLPS